MKQVDSSKRQNENEVRTVPPFGSPYPGLHFTALDQRSRLIYAYPPSSPPSPSSPTHSQPLSNRLRNLQAELESLEAELADPTNPLLRGDDQGNGNHIDPGELMRGLVDVRGRLEKVKKAREGRGRLVGVVLGADEEGAASKQSGQAAESKQVERDEKELEGKGNLTELDRRLGELEELIGSSSVALDEVRG